MRFAFAALVSFAVAAAAQQPAIEVKRLWTMVDRDGHGFRGPPAHMTALSGGRFVLVEEQASASLPVIVDSTGRFLRNLGRQGSGPGEFASFSGPFHVGVGDTLFVSNAGEISVFDSRLRFVRSFRTGAGPVSDFALVPEGFAVIGRTPGANGGAIPYHVVNRDGRLIRSMGFEPPSRELYRFLLAPSSHGIWTNRYTRHLIEHWTSDAKADVVIDTIPGWFRVPPRPGYPPFSFIRSMREVNGQLWVMSQNPVPNIDEIVKEATGQRSAIRDGAGPPLPIERMYTAAIEVYDAGSGRLMAQRLIPAFGVQFIGDNRFVVYSVNGDGLAQLEIWEMKLTR